MNPIMKTPSVRRLAYYSRNSILAAGLLMLTTAQSHASVLAYWRFEGSTSASYLADSSGNGYNLSNTGTTITTTAPASGFGSNIDEPGVGVLSNDQSAVLSTSATKLTVAAQSAFNTNIMTVEAMVNLTDMSKTTTILGQNTNGTATNGGWGFFVSSGVSSSLGLSRLCYTFSNGTTWVTVNSGVTLSLNNSYYLAVAVDALAGAATFFVQDLTAGTDLDSYTKTFTASEIADSTAPLYVGGSASYNYYTGTIDEVRFSNTALSESGLLSVVPEPASYAMLMGGIFFGFFLIRRKSRHF